MSQANIEVNAAASGTFRIGGDVEVHRLGFGAMRVTGPGIWEAPQDPGEARRVLARLPELGVNLIDTADSYGPFVSEDLLREALHPYGGLLIATKGGLARHGPDVWKSLGRPEYLRQCVLMSLRRLGVEEIEAASSFFEVATVQNLYNLTRRDSEEVLSYCERHEIGFLPWYPLAAGKLAEPGGLLDEVAAARGATHAQVALAWLLAKSSVMLPIPGTGKVAHLEQNVAAAGVALDADEVGRLDRAGRAVWQAAQASA